MDGTNPTARALLTLELIQNSPGISADRLAAGIGLSDRAVRRYVAVLRAAGMPIESSPGRYGGYRVGRGLRLPPLMFSTAEALELVMAVLEGEHGATDSAGPAATALGKIIRVLPERVGRSADTVSRTSARRAYPAATPSPETTAALVQACTEHHRLRLGYRLAPGRGRPMDVDPWAVVVRHGRWYLLCWSHAKQARRVLRVDRVADVEVLGDTFTAPDIDPVQTLEEHLAEGWRYDVEVVIDAPVAEVGRWLPRSRGRLEAIDAERTRLVATTDEPDWYAQQLAAIRAPFRIVAPPELRQAARRLGERLLHAGHAVGTPDG